MLKQLTASLTTAVKLSNFNACGGSSYASAYIRVFRSTFKDLSVITQPAFIWSWGHYWACIKDLHSPCSYLCNDKLVSNVEESYLNNTTSYILFYSKV